MSDHTLTLLMVLLAIIAIAVALAALGVGALAVSNHPARAKAAKPCFVGAYLFSLLAAYFFWLISAAHPTIRAISESVWLVAISVGLFAGFRFANLSLIKVKLTVFIQDVTTEWIYDHEHFRENVPIGTSITIAVHIVNDSPTPTTLHNFTLTAEAGDEKVSAPYPEEEVSRDAAQILKHEKSMTNLVTYLSDPAKPLTEGVGIEGYLTFRLPGFGLPEKLEAEGWVGLVFPGAKPLHLTLGIKDGLGKYHFFKDAWGNRPRPSRRLDEPLDDAPYTIW